MDSFISDRDLSLYTIASCETENSCSSLRMVAIDIPSLISFEGISLIMPFDGISRFDANKSASFSAAGLSPPFV